MNGVLVYNGKLHYGKDTVFGKNVTIDVAEKVVIGDRCVIPDNAYFGGRRVEIGNDWYGYSHEWRRLDIGRGRRDEEDAILRIGHRVTTHDNRIDLAKSVTIGDDVGLSPECTIYTHGYWQSVLEGFPCSFKSVEIKDGVIVGYRSTILPGSVIGKCAVIGAHSLVHGQIGGYEIYGGAPARRISTVIPPSLVEQCALFARMMLEYEVSCKYRNIPCELRYSYPVVDYRQCRINVESCTIEGTEDEYTDDLRWFLFTRGIRLYTKRLFKKMRKQ